MATNTTDSLRVNLNPVSHPISLTMLKRITLRSRWRANAALENYMDLSRTTELVKLHDNKVDEFRTEIKDIKVNNNKIKGEDVLTNKNRPQYMLFPVEIVLCMIRGTTYMLVSNSGKVTSLRRIGYIVLVVSTDICDYMAWNIYEQDV